MNLKIPKLSLVVLVGPSGSGKSTFARKHFLPTEVLSSDDCRGLVSDDENDQAATSDAFEVLHFVTAKRLTRGHLTGIDATNVQSEARKPLVQLAKKHHCLPVAIVLNPPEKVCHERNRERDDRMFGPHVVCAVEALGANDHWRFGSSPSALRRWNGLFGENRYDEYMNASSACWHLKASQSIRDCDVDSSLRR